MNDWAIPEGFTKDGPGVMVLGGAWVDGGATIVANGGDSIPINAGTLAINGGFGGSGGWNSIGVASGATLAGAGTINTTPTRIHAGGTLAPGWAGVGPTLTLAADSPLFLESGSILAYTLGTGTGGDSFLSVGGDLTLNSNITLAVTPGGSWGAGTYCLATFGSVNDNSGSFSGWTVTGAGLGFHVYSFSLSGGSLDLTVGGMGWIAPGGGSWADPTNWADGVIPTNLGDVAIFVDSIGTTNPAIVTLDGNRTLSGLIINTTLGGSYFITSTDGSTLTLANNGTPVPVTVGGGSHTLDVPVTLADDLSFTASAGAMLTVSGPISESGGSRAVSVNGGGHAGPGGGQLLQWQHEHQRRRAPA